MREHLSFSSKDSVLRSSRERSGLIEIPDIDINFFPLAKTDIALQDLNSLTKTGHSRSLFIYLS